MKIPLLVLAALALQTAPVAAQRPQTTYVAPTEQTVFTHIEESAGSVPGQTIWINNRSSVPIIVYSAALRDCENVRQSCSPMRLNLKVRPSSRAVLLRVNPKSPFQGFRYNISFGYRADSSNIAAMRVLAAAGNTEAQERLDATAAAAERQPTIGAADVYLDEAALIALGAKVARMVTVPESLVVREGRAFLLREVKLMAVDSAGGLLGRVATGTRWSLPETPVLMNNADTLLATGVGRVEIRFEAKAGERILEARFIVIVVAEPPLLLGGGAPPGARARRSP